MNRSEPRSLELSLQVYRRLLGIYPAAFLGRFGDQLAQTFADLARRAVRRGGVLRLLILWMQILPDLGTSALREHLSVTSWTAPSRLRLRWVTACSLGTGFGFLAGSWIGGSGEFYPFAHSSLFMLVLGIFQSVQGLKLPRGLAARWTVATIVGIFLLALPARTVLYGWWSFQDVVPASWALILLRGLGIGVCQFLVFPATFTKRWYWIPANALAVAFTDLAITAVVAVVLARGPAGGELNLLPFVTGGLFGLLTAIPLGRILRPADDAPVEGAVQS
jgi:hypothetical protein